MARKPQTKAIIPTIVPEENPERKADREKYDKARKERTHSRPGVVLGSFSVRQIVEGIETGAFRVPAFQRDIVWSDHDVLRLLDSLFEGFYVGPLLLWERYDIRDDVPVVAGSPGGTTNTHGYLVVDGQQRIAAIGRAFLSDRFSFDCEGHHFLVDAPDSPSHLPLSYLRSVRRDDLFAWFDRGGSVGAAGLVTDYLVFREVARVVLPSRWEIDHVMEMFRRLNTTGVRMEPGDVENALRRAISPPRAS